MEQANLPSQEGLNALYGAWNPMSYMQGHLNQDLASQFRDQAYQTNAGDLAKTQIANEQSIAMNPMLLEQQSNKNTTEGVQARIAADTEGDATKAMHSKLATQLTDDDVKQLQNDIQTKLIKGTPEEQQQASQAYGHLMEVMKAKTLSDAQFKQAKYTADSSAGNNRATIASNEKLEQMRIDAGKYRKADRFAIGFDSELGKAQGAAKKLAVVQQYMGLAQSDPELTELIPKLQALQVTLEPQAQAELAQTPKGGTVDIGTTTKGKVPVNPTPSLVGKPKPALPSGWTQTN